MKFSYLGGGKDGSGGVYRTLDGKSKITFMKVICKCESDEQIAAAIITMSVFFCDNLHTFIAH